MISKIITEVLIAAFCIVFTYLSEEEKENNIYIRTLVAAKTIDYVILFQMILDVNKHYALDGLSLILINIVILVFVVIDNTKRKKEKEKTKELREEKAEELKESIKRTAEKKEKIKKKSEIVCFRTEKNELILDHVLEVLDYIPIFFICIDNNSERYIVVLSENTYDKTTYHIIKTKTSTIKEMLLGRLSIAEAFTDKRNSNYYYVEATEMDDTIIDAFEEINELPKEMIPDKNKYIGKLSTEYIRKLMVEEE